MGIVTKEFEYPKVKN